jgi:hypothetical protein
MVRGRRSIMPIRPRSTPLTISLSLALSLSLVPLAAEAGKDHGGGTSGGGRLGQVSSGLGQATGGGGGSRGGGESRETNDRYYYEYEARTAEPAVLVGEGGVPVPVPPTKPTVVKFDFFAGAQKVYDSDGSLSIELALNEGRFRLGGSITRYYERQQGTDALTFTLPALYIGCRIDDGGPTRAYLEFGAVGAKTHNDPVMDSSIGGVLGGVRVEHRVSRRFSALGDAQVMVFEQDVRAAAMRAGVRVGHFQASVRYLDFSVGPALFGPEVGVRF